jgi:5-methylcytosine-specific restriction endonuclease McrA
MYVPETHSTQINPFSGIHIGPFKHLSRLGMIALDEGFDKITKVSLVGGKQYTCGTIINFSGKRLATFLEKGHVCVGCGITGSFFALERADSYSVYHLNLYACSKTGRFTSGIPIYKDRMMTVDHIRPVSKGGSNGKENLQTMCYKCNQKKADKYDGPTQDLHGNSVRRSYEFMLWG